MSGFGVMAFSNGDSYAGDWLDDAMHGAHGLYVKVDGTSYEGSWKHDLKHGTIICVVVNWLILGFRSRYQEVSEWFVLCG